jgi:hypothetical protein
LSAIIFFQVTAYQLVSTINTISSLPLCFVKSNISDLDTSVPAEFAATPLPAETKSFLARLLYSEKEWQFGNFLSQFLKVINYGKRQQ